VGMLTPGADPVRKVSIIPRGAALGVTLSTPDDDQVSYTREDLLGKIKVAVGGRVAEEIVFGTITTGAESDIEQVTAIARQMVGRWGMSEAIGFVNVLPDDGRAGFFRGSGETSEETQRVLDEEVRQLIDTAQRDVTAELTGQRDRLETLARALLKAETLDELDAYAAAQMPPRSAGAGEPAAAIAKRSDAGDGGHPQ
jgi:cell division protease FtsH